MKKLLSVAVFSAGIIIGCLGTDSDNKSEVSNLPDGFSATCYWDNQQSVQAECGKNNESCIESHYLEVGERADFEYECSDVGTSSDVVSSSEVEVSSSSLSKSGTFTDSRDNKSYEYVTIGTQVWMAENLNYKVSGSYCYDDDLNICAIYGRLYDWNTAMNGSVSSSKTPSGIQGVCPDGWHLPSNAEWELMAEYTSQQSGKTGKEGKDYLDLGLLLKSSLYDGTDNFGFSGLLSGARYPNGNYFGFAGGGSWWSSTENSNGFPWYRDLYHGSDKFYNLTKDKSIALSLRCLRD